MIELTALFDGIEVVYTADRDTREVDGGDPDGDQIPLLVDELLDSDQFIGPQRDELIGAWGSWATEQNIVAAFHDAVRQCGGQVLSWSSTDPPDPVIDDDE